MSLGTKLLLLLFSHSPKDVPHGPQRNISIATVRGAMRPSNSWNKVNLHAYLSMLSMASGEIWQYTFMYLVIG